MHARTHARKKRAKKENFKKDRVIEKDKEKHPQKKAWRTRPALQWMKIRLPSGEVASVSFINAIPAARSVYEGAVVSTVGSRICLMPASAYASCGPGHSTHMLTTPTTPCSFIAALHGAWRHSKSCTPSAHGEKGKEVDMRACSRSGHNVEGANTASPDKRITSADNTHLRR